MLCHHFTRSSHAFLGIISYAERLNGPDEGLDEGLDEVLDRESPVRPVTPRLGVPKPLDREGEMYRGLDEEDRVDRE